MRMRAVQLPFGRRCRVPIPSSKIEDAGMGGHAAVTQRGDYVTTFTAYLLCACVSRASVSDARRAS